MKLWLNHAWKPKGLTNSLKYATTMFLCLTWNKHGRDRIQFCTGKSTLFPSSRVFISKTLDLNGLLSSSWLKEGLMAAISSDYKASVCKSWKRCCPEGADDLLYEAFHRLQALSFSPIPWHTLEVRGIFTFPISSSCCCLYRIPSSLSWWPQVFLFIFIDDPECHLFCWSSP